MSELYVDATTVESELDRCGAYASVTSGVSMRPLFRTNRDMVILKKPDTEPKKYDVVLYKLPSGRYVLHRIIGVRDNRFIIRGDNTYSLEYVDKTDILAVLAEFNRRGKRVSVDNGVYLAYARVWNFIYPVRLVCHKVLSLAKKVYRKIFK